MNSLIAIIVTSLLFIIFGWNLTYLFPIEEKIERISLSFILGSGLTTLLWFYVNHLGFALDLPTFICTGIGLTLFGYFLKFKYKYQYADLISQKLLGKEYYIAIYIFLLLIIAFIIGLYNPLTAWDSLALYDFRGHAIALNHSLKDIVDFPYYLSYPLMTSLVHAIVYMLGGLSAQGIHAIFFASFIGIIFGRMTKWTNRYYALITCLAVATQYEIYTHATFAYTNLPYLVYLVSGLLYAVSPSFILSGILIGLSTWTRSSEVFWLIGIVILLWQGFRSKRVFSAVFSIVIILSIKYSWTSFVGNILLSLGQTEAPRISRFNAEAFSMIVANSISIAKYVYWNILLPYVGIWLLTIPLLIIGVVKRNFKIYMFLVSIILTASMTVGGVMIFSTYFRTWNQIGDSARRMILFVGPLTIVASMYSIFLINQKGKK